MLNNSEMLKAATIAAQLEAYMRQCEEARSQIKQSSDHQAGYRYANIDEIVIEALSTVILQLQELATLLKERTENSVIYENPGSLASLNEVFNYVTAGNFIRQIATSKNFCGRHHKALELYTELLSREIAVLKAEVALDQLKAKRLQTRDKIKAKKQENTLYAVLKQNPVADNDELAAKLSEFQTGRHYTIDHQAEANFWLGNRGLAIHFYEAEVQAVFDIVEMPIIPPQAA